MTKSLSQRERDVYPPEPLKLRDKMERLASVLWCTSFYIQQDIDNIDMMVEAHHDNYQEDVRWENIQKAWKEDKDDFYRFLINKIKRYADDVLNDEKDSDLKKYHSALFKMVQKLDLD